MSISPKNKARFLHQKDAYKGLIPRSCMSMPARVPACSILRSTGSNHRDRLSPLNSGIRVASEQLVLAPAPVSREGRRKWADEGSANMLSLCKKDLLMEALDRLDLIEYHRIRMNSCSYATLLQECIDMKSLAQGKRVHAHIVKSGIEDDAFIGNNLISMYTKCGSVIDAFQVFNQMRKRNVVSWNAIIAGCIQHGQSKEALRLFWQMLNEAVKPNKVTFISVLQACGGPAGLPEGRLVHAHAVNIDMQFDVDVGTALVNMYCKCASLNDAQQVFNKMPTRNVVSWTAMISGYAQHGHTEAVLKLFYDMHRAGVKPNKITLISVLNACARLTTPADGKLVHAYIVDGKVASDVMVETALVNMYGKCGSIENAFCVFNRTAKQDLVLWTAMIAVCDRQGHSKEALELFRQMQHKGVMPDNFTFSSVLSACTSEAALAEGKLVHAQILDKELESDVFMGTALVDMYSKCGCLENACQVFHRMPVRNVVSWTTMITGYAQHGHGKEALKTFWQMQKAGVKPNNITYTNVLTACAWLGALAEGRLVHSHIVDSGVVSDIFLGNSLIDMYARCDSLEAAFEVFSKMPKHDIISWNSMIAGCAQYGYSKEALKLFQHMKLVGMKPDQFTFSSILSACASITALTEGKQVHAQIIKVGLETNIFVGTALIDFYAKCRQIVDACQVFDRMPKRDLIMWSAIIAGCTQHGDGKRTLELFQQMIREDVKPDQFIFSSVLSACARLAALDQGRQIHGHIIKSGFDRHIIVATALVDMYAKCGNIEDACQVFDKMPKRDLVSWNTLIAGCAQHGYGKEALELFEKMQQEDMKPDGFTFTSVLMACSHVGMISEGCYYFDSMGRDYGLTRTVEHYACMVDLFGRAGCLPEAEDFINNLPFEPSSVLWMSLLSACKNYDNVELAERAADNILKLEPENAAAYVLLSNMHVSKNEKIMQNSKATHQKGIRYMLGWSK